MKKMFIAGLVFCTIFLVGCTDEVSVNDEVSTGGVVELSDPEIQKTEPVIEESVSVDGDLLTYSDKDISFQYSKDNTVTRQDDVILITPNKLSENQYSDEGASMYDLYLFKNPNEADKKANYILLNTDSSNNLCSVYLETDKLSICKFDQTSDEGMNGVGRYYNVSFVGRNLWIFIFDKSDDSGFVENTLLPSLKML